jgi:hypothetical protein
MFWDHVVVVTGAVAEPMTTLAKISSDADGPFHAQPVTEIAADWLDIAMPSDGRHVVPDAREADGPPNLSAMARPEVVH